MMGIVSFIMFKGNSGSIWLHKLVCLVLFVLSMNILQGQKLSMKVEKFSLVFFNSKVPIILLEDERDMVVFDGYLRQSIRAEVSKGVLNIGAPKRSHDGSGSIVVLYNRNRKAPRIISITSMVTKSIDYQGMSPRPIKL